ncbi:MAG: CoB--CoM heterodisulfide reductase iron-sulfur subunit A family protein [Myxococcota bacterium]|nr:CoB--CoM heterodisulfide reductase iron-sulfur subunit A family protein [Myxococcota bacterium]
MKEKIGLFVCRCGDNIAGVIDVDALSNQVGEEADISFVAGHDLLCSPDGKKFLAEKITEQDATHVVIAACSPKDHEAGFQKVIESVGVNKHLLQMANIREHCTWVTADSQQAQKKSLAMVKAAIERVRFHEKLEEKEIECNANLLVVGGGVAGMEAALLAAQAGRKVTLVEASPSVGGVAPEFEEVAPNMECAPCMLSPRIDELGENSNITLMTNSRVTEVLGYLGNFEVKINKKARQVDEDLCIGCDECIQACPVSVPSEIQHGLGDRKAIYIPFPGSLPNCATIDREACLRSKGEACTACADACPMECVNFDQEDEEHELTVGAAVLATGFSTFNPSGNEKLGFGKLKDVYTLEQFERLGSNHGPTGGKILKANGEPPERIAVVHCVGRKELAYCSGMCCQAALKVGLVTQHKEENGEEAAKAPTVVHLHTDLVSKDWLGAQLLHKAEKHGAEFIRISDPESVEVKGTGDGIGVAYEDAAGKRQSISADMVVLVTGMQPSAGTNEMIEIMQLNTDDAGFAAPDHPLLRPTQSSFDGIFLAGCVSGPKGISDSIAQAKAASGMAMARVQPGKKLSLEVITAHTDEAFCSNCLVCVSVCPYKACVYDEYKDVVQVNEVICHGCGTCVAACASGAAEARKFTDKQIGAEIEEVLNV